MKTLGIDIGTTTISAAVLEDGQFLASETRANGAFIPSALGVRTRAGRGKDHANRTFCYRNAI